MPEFLQKFLSDFGIAYSYERVLVFGLIIAWVVVLVLRLVLASGYRTQLALMRNAVKEGFANKEAAEKCKSAFLRRAALDYIALGEGGLARIDSRELAEKSGQKFKLLFWSYGRAGVFLDAMEPAIFIAGIVFTFIATERDVFAALTLIMFAAGKLLSTFFDYRITRDELYAEASFVLDKEIGKLYVTDAAGSINNLRVELKNIISYQTKYLGETINDMKEKLVQVSEKTLGDTAASIKGTLESISVNAQTVLEPLELWRKAILDSRKAHEELNISLVKMSGATDGFKDRLAELDKLVEGYKSEFLTNNQNVEKELARLNNLTQSVMDVCKNAGAQTESVEATLEFVRRGQGMLENSMNQYEITLKDITSQVGTGLGKILEFHVQNSYNALTDSAVDNIRQAGALNAHLMGKLQNLLDRILEQSKNETAIIINLKEHMELELSALRTKLTEESNRIDEAAKPEPKLEPKLDI